MVRDLTFSIFSGVVLLAACCTHPCQHVEASNLEDDPSILEDAHPYHKRMVHESGSRLQGRGASMSIGMYRVVRPLVRRCSGAVTL